MHVRLLAAVAAASLAALSPLAGGQARPPTAGAADPAQCAA